MLPGEPDAAVDLQRRLAITRRAGVGAPRLGGRRGDRARRGRPRPRTTPPSTPPTACPRRRRACRRSGASPPGSCRSACRTGPGPWRRRPMTSSMRWPAPSSSAAYATAPTIDEALDRVGAAEATVDASAQRSDRRQPTRVRSIAGSAPNWCRDARRRTTWLGRSAHDDRRARRRRRRPRHDHAAPDRPPGRRRRRSGSTSSRLSRRPRSASSATSVLEHRRRRDVRADLLEQHGGLDPAEAEPARGLGARRRRGQPWSTIAATARRRRRTAGVDDRPHLRRRRVIVEQVARRVPQRELVVGELEVHGVTVPDARQVIARGHLASAPWTCPDGRAGGVPRPSAGRGCEANLPWEYGAGCRPGSRPRRRGRVPARVAGAAGRRPARRRHLAGGVRRPRRRAAATTTSSRRSWPGPGPPSWSAASASTSSARRCWPTAPTSRRRRWLPRDPRRAASSGASCSASPAPAATSPPLDAGRAGRRRLAAQRPEGLDVATPSSPTGASASPAPIPDAPKQPGHLRLRRRHARRGRRRAAAACRSPARPSSTRSSSTTCSSPTTRSSAPSTTAGGCRRRR